ncbi:P-loop containing nucleoside triphosphate hydrolase protein [Mycena galericulata]|nr:P-loop containing nucleoside triphosphate hydrolase protein [Mycena galericulata]
MSYYDQTGQDAPTESSSWLASFMGLSSIFGALGILSQSHIGSSLRLLILGTLIETGRRFSRWLIERFRFQYSITAQFNEGDPAYEWIVLFITQERVWKRSREFVVSAKNSQRKWAVDTASDSAMAGNAEYVPMYQIPQLFRWRGFWLEIKRGNGSSAGNNGAQQTGHIYVTIYTLDMNVLSQLVEEARLRYVEVNRPHVVIHLNDSARFNPRNAWANVKHKIRRPLSSIILPPGLLDSLVQDAQEFLKSEDWYIGAGIPHRRGYLLHGPPGTGKTSTIYALAGALNLEIYSLSLASHSVDDNFLQQAAASIPKNGLFLIEDVDCAFPSREDDDDEEMPPTANTMNQMMPVRPGRGSRAVTLSGLLNVIDGVGSEEGKLFFATTNYIDRLDAAFLRPGRIDKKIEYGLATPEQARALFARFFPEERFPSLASSPSDPESKYEYKISDPKTQSSEKNLHGDAPTQNENERTLPSLASHFAASVPANEFSTAELQGFLQGFKTRPAEAADGVRAWVEGERRERRAREEREEERRRKARMRAMGGGHAGVGIGVGTGMGLGQAGSRAEREDGDGEPRGVRRGVRMRPMNTVGEELEAAVPAEKY